MAKILCTKIDKSPECEELIELINDYDSDEEIKDYVYIDNDCIFSVDSKEFILEISQRSRMISVEMMIKRVKIVTGDEEEEEDDLIFSNDEDDEDEDEDNTRSPFDNN